MGRDSKSKAKIAQLEDQMRELDAELEHSEDARNDLKRDLEEANARVIAHEEELYECKSIQLELLESLKQAEERIVELEHLNVDRV